jgi:hypothetical protein
MVPGDRSPFDTSMIFLPGAEFYACFNFNSPWAKPMQGLQFSTIIDNTEMLHHWLFYESPLGVQDGSYSYCTGQHPGQAPGALIGGVSPSSLAALIHGVFTDVLDNDAYGSTRTDMGDSGVAGGWGPRAAGNCG